jgi:hypothetical protein
MHDAVTKATGARRVLLGSKVPPDIAIEVRRQAAAEDRSTSSYISWVLRQHLAALTQRQ